MGGDHRSWQRIFLRPLSPRTTSLSSLLSAITTLVRVLNSATRPPLAVLTVRRAAMPGELLVARPVAPKTGPLLRCETRAIEEDGYAPPRLPSHLRKRHCLRARPYPE